MLKDTDTAAGETKTAETMLRDAGFPNHAGESVLVESKTATLSDPRFRAAVEDVDRTVSALPNVQNVRSPLAPGNAGQISSDRRSALVQFEIAGDQDKADEKVQPILDAVGTVQDRHDGFTVAEFGFASANHELNDTLNKDFQRAEYSSLPVTLIILLIAFGALVAAGLPVLLAFSGVLATIGLSALASHVVAAGDATKSVILLIGMAVGVDYSLFYLRREREERARGLSPKRGVAEDLPHVRPRDPDLRPDRADRDGRDAVHRQRRVHLDRSRRDADGRRSADRLAVDPPGAARQARAPRRQGPDPVPGAQPRARVTGLGLRPRRRHATAGRRGSALRRRARRSRRSGADAAHTAAELHRPAEVAADRPHLRVDPARVPGGPVPGEGGGRRPRRDSAARTAGDRRPQAAGARERSDVRADLDRGELGQDDRDGLDRDAGERLERRVRQGPGDPQGAGDPVDARHRLGREGGRDRRDGRAPTTSTSR